MKRTGLLPRTTYVRDARLFVVAVEGEVEEPWYFEGLVDHGLVDGQRVRLVVLPSEGGRSAPEHVAARLAQYEAEQPLIPADPRWLVVDVDRHHNLLEVLAEAEQRGWNFAVSNPCFEVWLQLHLQDDPVGADSGACKAEWRRLRATHPGWPFTAVHVDQACARSRSRHSTADWVPAAPGSAVHRLVDALPRTR